MTEQKDTIAEATNGSHITIHSDGAAQGNPGAGGWGAVLCRMNGTKEIKRRPLGGFDPDPRTTNIRMEMIAAAAALEVIKPGEPQPIIVCPDLKLIMLGMTDWLPGWIAKGWVKADGKPVENRDLWERLIAAAEGKIVHWHWVRGHDGDERNELAHRLAQQQMHKAVAAMFSNAA